MTIAPTVAMVEPAPGARRAASPAVALMTSMLRRSLVFAHAGLLVALGIGFWMAGPLGALNAAFGGAVVVFFYAAGQGIQMLAGELDPQSGMGLTVVSYVTRVTLLGLLWVGINASPALAEAFRPAVFLTAVLVVLAAWLAGMFVAWSQARVPVYDQDFDPRPKTPGHRSPRPAARARRHDRRSR